MATRAALLEAARELVFEKGHDGIAVQEITKRARLATGTYYNYFDTKPDIFPAVAEDMKNQMVDELEVIRKATKDPAMLIAITLKYYFYQTIDNQDWRDFTRYAGLKNMSLQQAAEQRVEDIERGVKAGRFLVDDVHFTQILISGMVDHVNQAINSGLVGRNAIEYAIRSILQMLGLPELVSKALTQTPLPPISAPRRAKVSTETSERVTSISENAGTRKHFY